MTELSTTKELCLVLHKDMTGVSTIMRLEREGELENFPLDAGTSDSWVLCDVAVLGGSNCIIAAQPTHYRIEHVEVEIVDNGVQISTPIVISPLDPRHTPSISVWSPFCGFVEDSQSIALDYRPNTIYNAILLYSLEDGLQLTKIRNEVRTPAVDVLFDSFPWHRKMWHGNEQRRDVSTALINRIDNRHNTDQLYKGIIYSKNEDYVTVYSKLTGVVPITLWKTLKFSLKLGLAVRFAVNESNVAIRLTDESAENPPVRRYKAKSFGEKRFAEVAVDVDVPDNIEHVDEAEFDVAYPHLQTTVRYTPKELEDYHKEVLELSALAGKRVRLYIAGNEDDGWQLSPRGAGQEWEADNRYMLLDSSVESCDNVENFIRLSQ